MTEQINSRVSGLLILMALAGCDGTAPMRVDAGPAPDDGAAPLEDAGPDLPDTGPPTCPTPDTWYRDLDGDGFGDMGASVESCEAVDGFVMEAGDCDDSCAACRPGGTETCDAADNDCDGTIDETEECVPGATVACTTACGTLGMGSCSAICEPPTGAECAPPMEVCNGADDNCDGSIDEAFACAAGSSVDCTTTCGSTGAGTCTATCGVPSASSCVPPAEVCNGADDDCDGAVDETFTCAVGEWVDCTSSCGSTGRGMCTGACELPSGTSCTPPAEVCNGADDDCDGAADQTFACAAGEWTTCTTTCGSDGFARCTSSCGVPGPSSCVIAPESCTYTDVDCDGLVDEGVRTATGPATHVSDPYRYDQPQVAATTVTIYAAWRAEGSLGNQLWVMNADGTRRAGRFALPGGAEFDLEASSSQGVYAYVDGGGDVRVHRLETTPSGTRPFAWSRTITEDAVEVQLAPGSTNLWVYVRTRAGSVRYYTLDSGSGAILGGPLVLGTAASQMSVAYNGFREHIVAWDGAFGITLKVFDRGVQELSWLVPSGGRTIRDFAITGDYDTGTLIRRRGVLLVYSLSSIDELRYFSYREGGATTDRRIRLGLPVNYGLGRTAFDVRMRDGVAVLGAALQSVGSTGYDGLLTTFQFARTSSALLSIDEMRTTLPVGRYEGVRILRMPASSGLPDRLFYDPTGSGTASIPIGC